MTCTIGFGVVLHSECFSLLWHKGLPMPYSQSELVKSKQLEIKAASTWQTCNLFLKNICSTYTFSVAYCGYAAAYRSSWQ